MTTKLYELTEQYRAVQEALDGDCDPADVEAALSAIKGEIEDKVENIGRLFLDLKAEADAIEVEIQRLQKRQTARQNHCSKLKDYLKDQMIAADINKIKRTLFSVNIQPCPPSVEVLDAEAIPQEYQRVIPEERVPNKKAIIEQYKKDGSIVSGCVIISDKKTIVIR